LRLYFGKGHQLANIVVQFPTNVAQGLFSNLYLRFGKFAVKSFFGFFLFFQQSVFSTCENSKQHNHNYHKCNRDCYCRNDYYLFFIHKKPVKKKRYIMITREICITIKSSKKVLAS